MKTADPQAITAQQFRRMENFIKSLLNPEELGLAVPAHVRDSAREALGRPKVEEVLSQDAKSNQEVQRAADAIWKRVRKGTKCPYRHHHHTCECQGEGGAR